MSKISPEELSKILKEHERWFDTDGDEGENANLYKADLSDADLGDAVLEGANLIGANLFAAYLVGANLSRADLYCADLSYAYLSDAVLEGADLSEVLGLNIEQLSKVKTLYKAKLDPELEKQVYPHPSYKTLSVSEVQSMPNVSIREKLELGFDGHSTIKHDYSLKAVSGDVVVVEMQQV